MENLLRKFALDKNTGRTFVPSMISTFDKDYYYLPDGEKIKKEDLVCHLCGDVFFVKALESEKKISHFAGKCDCVNSKKYNEEIQRVLIEREPALYVANITTLELEDYSTIVQDDLMDVVLTKKKFTPEKRNEKEDNVYYYKRGDYIIAILLNDVETTFSKNVDLVNLFVNGEFKYHSLGNKEKAIEDAKAYNSAKSELTKKRLESEIQKEIEKEFYLEYIATKEKIEEQKKLEVFKAKKGMNFETMYYHFMFMYNNEQYADCVLFIRLNKWWFNNMNEDVKAQIKRLNNKCEEMIENETYKFKI